MGCRFLSGLLCRVGAWLPLAVLGLSVSACDSGPALEQVDAGELCTSCAGCAEALPVLSAMHVTGSVDYPDTPPASGPHDGRCWSEWGTQETEVPAERWVHNLEHGGVVLLHDCGTGCEQELGQLREFVDTHERTLLTVYPELPTRFAIIAWGVRLLSDCLDLDAFEAFYSMHFDRAPESLSVPPAAACARSTEL